MHVRNTFIDFSSDAKQASSFARQSTEPAPTLARCFGAETGGTAMQQPPLMMMAHDPQREVVAECSEDPGSDLELEPGAFQPQVTEYEFGPRPQDMFMPSVLNLLSSMTAEGPGPMSNVPMNGPPMYAGNMQMAAGGQRAPAFPPREWAGKSSVMLRNLPCDYTQQTLLAEVNQSGFEGSFDFFYLPIDKGTGGNKGYAFMNFSDASVAWHFKLAYDGRTMSRFNSDKLVSVMPAALQGFDANYAHYANSRVKRGDPSCRPLFFRAPPAEPLRPLGKLASPAGVLAAISGKAGARRKGLGRLEQLVETQRREELIQQAVNQLATSVVQQQQSMQRPELAAPATPAAPAEGGARHFCFSCGSKVTAGFKFCPDCGTCLA